MLSCVQSTPMMMIIWRSFSGSLPIMFGRLPRFCRCRSCNRQGTMCLGPKHYEYVVQDGIVPLYSSVMPCLLAIAWNVGAMVRTSDGNWFDLQMFHFRPVTHKTYCATKLHALQPCQIEHNKTCSHWTDVSRQGKLRQTLINSCTFNSLQSMSVSQAIKQRIN